jgi:hypothetical protein
MNKTKIFNISQMDISSLIVPKFFSPERVRRGDEIGPEKKVLYSVEEVESEGYWSSLAKIKTKYPVFMTGIIENIRIITKDKDGITPVAFDHLWNTVENFIDRKLSAIDGSAFTIDSFGDYALNLWSGFTEDEIRENSNLDNFSKDLQDCLTTHMDRVSRSETGQDDAVLYTTLIATVMTRFLEQVLAVSGKERIISLFHCVYVEETDIRFKFLRSGFIFPDLIPVEPSVTGLTAEHIKLELADFIRKYYSQRPSLEEGVLQLLAGSSNIINVEDERQVRLSHAILKELGETSVVEKGPEETLLSESEEVFFTLHRYILYLTLETIQLKLSVARSSSWTIKLVLDSLNSVAEMFYNKVDFLSPLLLPFEQESLTTLTS